jgi:hypothetical protein
MKRFLTQSQPTQPKKKIEIGALGGMELQRENVVSSEETVDDVDTSDLTDRPNDMTPTRPCMQQWRHWSCFPAPLRHVSARSRGCDGLRHT